MSDVPKIVQDRLRAAVPREAHPEVDVLTAFAEQALSGTEREGVLRHLARCEDCREVVALSLPPLPDAATQSHREGSTVDVVTRVDRAHAWFAWPNLRWAALAASVVVVASVLMLRPGKEPALTDASVTVPSLNAPSVDVSAAKPDQVHTSTDTASATEPLSRSSENAFNKAGRVRQPASSAARRDEGFSDTPPARVTTQAAELEDRKAADRADAVQVSQNKDRPKALELAPAAPVARAEMTTREQMRAAGEAVEVSGSNAAVQTEASNIEPLVTNETRALPVEKAKPALKEETESKTQAQDGLAKSNLAPAYETSNSTAILQRQASKRSSNVMPQWSLADGKLLRSLDAGATRQAVLQLQTPLLAFGAQGNEVWAGGQAGALLRSSDGGSSWTVMHPATKDGALTADVVAINVRSGAEIVVSTKDGETWTTTDAGKTWTKK
jgi:hypothetical protein